MMPWPGLLFLAALLDAWAGDPRCRWHPVRLMGGAALRLEHPLRWITRQRARAAGIGMAVLLPGGCAVLAGGLILGAGWAHPVAGAWMGVLLVYSTIAGRDMQEHAQAVLLPLTAGDLPAARHALSRMVGRDTHALDEAGIARAVVESIAEGLVDGAVAPVVWAMVGGIAGDTADSWLNAAGQISGGSAGSWTAALPGMVGMGMGAVLYRAVNTLDSTFGYKTEAYEAFGWASARLDDAMNYLPARLAAGGMGLAGLLLRYNASGCLRTWWRDGGRHESPNAGQCEAAMAGALGVELGGRCTYGGEEVAHPRIGVGGRCPGKGDISDARRLFRVTFWLILLMAVGAGLLLR